MLRFVELALFLAPFALFAAWRFVATEGPPPVRFIAAAACLLVALTAMLIWLSREHALPPDASYEPARLEDGKIVSGHAIPP